jgi:hypothetical protein
MNIQLIHFCSSCLFSVNLLMNSKYYIYIFPPPLITITIDTFFSLINCTFFIFNAPKRKGPSYKTCLIPSKVPLDEADVGLFIHYVE